MSRQSDLSSAALLFCFLALQGCGGGGGGGDPQNNPPSDTTNTTGGGGGVDSGVDTDKDGLTDFEEINTYGTSPIKADTDGDGISDFDEIVTYSFNPALDNFKYNPLIADVPIIDINIVTAPDIALKYQLTNGSSNSASTSRSTSNTSAVTTEKTNSNSTVIESASTTGSELSFGAEITIGLEPSLSLSVNNTYSSSYTNSTSKESSFSWTNAQTSENSKTLEQASSIETNNSVSVSSGFIKTAVKVSNFGNRSFTLNDLSLSAAMVSKSGTAILKPVSNLTYDDSNGVSGFPSISLAGGESTGTIIFSAADVDASTVKSLLADSTGMKVGVSAYELKDINGTPFAFAREQVNASTATVIIDYDEALSQPERRFLVSTVGKPSVLTVSAGSVLKDILKIPHTVGANGGLDSVESISGDNTNTGWIVLHKTKTSSGTAVANLFSYKGAYDFDSITLKAGDVLHLVYQIDTDGDGLGQRLEAMFGTDTSKADTDGDGLTDSFEVFKGWKVTFPANVSRYVTSSPTKADTDGDGLTDDKEFAAGTDPRKVDTDGDLLNDKDDPNPLEVNFALNAQNLKATFTDIDATTGKVDLAWAHTWNGGFNSGRDIVLRQISSSPAFGTEIPAIAPAASAILPSVGSWLACGAVTNCWEVVGIKSTDNNSTSYNFTDSNLERTTQYRYAVLSEYSDGGTIFYYMYDSASSLASAATAGKLKRVTITMKSVSLASGCVDYRESQEFSSKIFSNCEPYFAVRFNNELIASRYLTPLQSNTDVITATSGSSSGSLTPGYVLWQSIGINTWEDPTNPDLLQRGGYITASVDVLDTATKVTLQLTAGERDATVGETTCADQNLDNCNGNDDSHTVAVDVDIQGLSLDVPYPRDSSVSWSLYTDVGGEDGGTIAFSYSVKVTAP